MRRYIYPYFLAALTCILVISCQSENETDELELDSESFTKANVERSFEKGKILNPLTIDGRALESYALYLPENYFSGYTWPTIFYFDPQGNGAKAVELYRDLADKFGFILIGSNFSRNGKSTEELLAHINALKHNLPEAIKIDQFRIFLVGFSGGARIAVADAMANGDVAGVVGCGAGFPQLNNDVELSFNYLAMVGRQDFNYSEFVVLDKELSNRGSKHLLIEYDGKHEWPGPEQMLEAFKWMTVYSYSQREVIDMAMLDSLHTVDLKTLAKLESSDDLRAIHQYYKMMISLYKGLAKVEEQEKGLKMLSNSSAYKQYEANLESVLANEMKSRNKYTQLMTGKDDSWWKADVADIRKQIAEESNIMFKNSQLRLLAYLSLASYFQADAALSKSLLPQAKKFLYILDLVDPNNPDFYYLSARLLLKQGRNEDAVEMMKEAVNYGFEDWGKIENERVFDPIRSYLRTLQD